MPSDLLAVTCTVEEASSSPPVSDEKPQMTIFITFGLALLLQRRLNEFLFLGGKKLKEAKRKGVRHRVKAGGDMFTILLNRKRVAKLSEEHQVN